MTFFLFQLIGAVYAVDAVNPAAVAPDASVAEDSNNISLDFKDADINTVLRVMSLKSKVNIVAGPEVQGTVTIRLENVPWEKALEVVLRTYGYVYERDENIIRVTTRENLATEDVITQTHILNYTKAEEVEAAVKDMLTERGRIKTASRTNTIVITDIPTNLYRVSEVIKKLDKITPQAFIDSKIIKTSITKGEDLGIVWNVEGGLSSGASRPTTFPFTTSKEQEKEGFFKLFGDFLPQVTPATSTTSFNNSTDDRSIPSVLLAAPTNSGGTAATFGLGTLNAASMAATLKMLQSRANTKTVSNPRIVVLNNQTAKVQVGQQIPLPTFERNETTGSLEVSGFSYRDVGVVLNVTPHINSEEEILVDLKPEVSSEGTLVTFTADLTAPRFNVTQAVTQVLIRSGETIAIGGLMSDAAAVSEAKVPFFGDVPFVGKIFRSKRQTANATNEKVETLFFVTVTMIDTEGQPTGERATEKSKRNKKSEEAKNAPAQEEKVETSAASETPSQRVEPSSGTNETTEVTPAESAATEAQTSTSPQTTAAQ